MESTGLGDDVEKWLASGMDVRRLAVPAQMVTVPGVGPLLVLAVVGWPDSITVLTVEPGLGVDYNEELAARFPYDRAYLPVNRKLDGTMWNW